MAWADIINKQSSKKTDRKYLAIPVGQTIVRILDEEPVSRWVHWVPQANHGKGLSVNCLGKDCPICEAMNQEKKLKGKSKYNIQRMHSINVINRATGEVEILEKGNKIFEALAALYTTVGDLRGYDVIINKTGEGLGNVNYTVIPKYPPTPLTEEEQKLPRHNLEELVRTLSREQVLQLMTGAGYDDIFEKEETNQEDNGEEMPDFTSLA